MKKEIEETISKYFHTKWREKDVNFWIGKTKFEVDYPSLDKNLNVPIGDFIKRGGKRWRPVLFLTTLKLLGEDWKKYLDVAFALELAHNATLVIDDIEDNAQLRRGKSSCHIIFGTDIAINAGAAMHFLPLKILSKKRGITEQQKAELFKIYADEITNVYFGQAMDIAWHKNPHLIKISQYLEMTSLKTGGLVRMASRMACVLAGRKDLEKDIVNFSELAGIAFQVKDDCLEFTASSKNFGKSFGNDITEGKISMPVIFALQKISEDEKIRLLEILSLHTADKNLLKEAINMIIKSGAVRESLNYADELICKAWEKIESKLPHANKKHFEDFKDVAYSAVKRGK